MNSEKFKNILIILLFIIIIGLLSIIVVVKTNEKDENVIEEGASIKIDDSKDYVYDAQYDDINLTKLSTSVPGNYNDNAKVNITYDGKVPYININSEDAKIVNNKIKKIYDEYILKVKNYDATIEGLEPKAILGYKVYEYKNYLSILFTDSIYISSAPYPSYSAYTFNKETGELVSNNELLNITGFTSDMVKEKTIAATNSLLEKLGYANENALINNFTGNYSEYNKNKIESYFYSRNEYSCVGNCQEEGYIYFINNEGVLNIIISLYVPVQEGIYPQLFEIK